MRIIILFLLVSFSSISLASNDITSYVNLKQGDEDKQLADIRKEQDLRLRTMKDAAIQLGIQVGFNYELDNIKESISSIEPELSDVFDFGVMMRSTNSGKFEMFMLPGIVEEYKGSLKISDDGKKATTTEKTLRIIETEKMVSQAPDWRNYLYLNTKVDVQHPFNAILPKADSKEEQDKWKSWFLEGYDIGINQANAEVVAKARKLRRDFVGRVKYIRYILDKKITPPALSLFREDLITSNNEMRINERVYSVSQPAKFNPATGEWEVLLLDNREGFRNKDEK